MKRIFILFLIVIFSISSCKKKTLELPIISISGVSNITNFSEIWVFYNSTQDKRKAKINKNNTISTTNWIINIDKRLTIKEVIPILQMIKAKRAKKSLHSVEGTKNYLSYANDKDKNISLYSIDSIHYLALDKVGFDDLSYHYNTDHILKLSKNSISLNEKELPLNTLNKQMFDTLQIAKIHLFYDADITYDVYLQNRVKLKEYTNAKFEVDTTEYLLNF